MKTSWNYGMTTSDKLNIRKSPSLTAQRWNNIWPINRIALIKVKDEDWYQHCFINSDTGEERVVDDML